MNGENEKLLEYAFELKNAGKFKESIDELKRVLEKDPDSGIASGMVAALYYSELNDPERALPYAKKAVSIYPKHELSSFCLAVCLFDLDQKDQMISEIERYVATGGEIDLYRTLFEENNLTIEDFT